MTKNWQIGMATHRGTIKKSNEDSHFYTIYKSDNGTEIALFIVADGMGGYEAGDVASEMAIEVVKDWWEKRISKVIRKKDVITQCLREIKKVIDQINDEIIRISDHRSIKMGTTISILFLYQGEYGIIHIGDSRIYLLEELNYGFRPSPKRKNPDDLNEQTTDLLDTQINLKKLTEDHSWVEKQVKEGLLSEELAHNHPKRHVLTQCLGINREVKPYIQSGNYQKRDLFLVCTDGFYSLFSHEEIKNMLISLEEEYGNLQAMCDYLINFSNFSEADDNITVFLIRNSFIKQVNRSRSLFSFLKFG